MKLEIRSVMRFLLMVIATFIIIGGVGLWFMNQSLAWQMLDREATVKIDDGKISVDAEIELKKPSGLITGFMLNPGLEIESVTVGGKAVSFTRFSSLVVFPAFGLPDEEGIVKMHIAAQGTPINPANERMLAVADVTDDYWLVSPDALWIPANSDPSGRLLLHIDVPANWKAQLPGHLVSREAALGRELSQWLVPATQPALLVGQLTTVETRGQVVAARLPGIGLDVTSVEHLSGRILDGLAYLNQTAGLNASGDTVVLAESSFGGSWSNLHVLQPSRLQSSAAFMHSLGAGKWQGFFRGGATRNWMADSLAGYLSLIYQSEQEGEPMSAALGKLAADYNIQLKRGYKTNLRDLGGASDDVYQSVGFTKAIFFWHRLRAEMGDEQWVKLLSNIQSTDKLLDESALCSLIAEVADAKLASIADGWITKNYTPGFYLGAFKMDQQAGLNTLQVVVWQSRPFVRGTVLVRVYGPNGETADKEVYIDVLNAKVDIPVDFQPVALAIDPENDWLNSNGSHQLMTLSTLYSPKDVAIVYSADALTEEQRSTAKASADALVLNLKQSGMRAQSVADQGMTWAKLEKANVVLLSTAGAKNSLVESDWSVRIPEADNATILAGYSLVNPEKRDQGVWVFAGELPVVADQWAKVLRTHAMSATFGPEYQVQSTVLPDAVRLDSWLHTDQLYDLVTVK